MEYREIYSASSRVRTLLASFLSRLLLCSLTTLVPPIDCQQITVDGQDLGRFISLDCGGEAGRDNLTTIEWSPDEPYLDSAEDIAAHGRHISAMVNSESLSMHADNKEQLKTARVFPPGPMARAKYCYNLPVKYDPTFSYNYLVRVTFPPSNNMTLKNGSALPDFVDSSRFYLTIDSTFVHTVELSKTDYQTIEVIAGTLDDFMFVCLVPLEDRSSMPAISSLELRPLAPGLYERGGNTTQDPVSVLKTTYLRLIYRLNCGADPNLPSLRYPHDMFDRIWFGVLIEEQAAKSEERKAGSRYKDVRNTTAVSWGESWGGLKEKFRHPVELMVTACEGDPGFDILFIREMTLKEEFRPLPTFYSVILVNDIVAHDAKEKRYMTIKLNDRKWLDPDIDFSLGPQTLYSPRNVFPDNRGIYSFYKNESSTLPAMLNAAELYGEFEAVMERTHKGDDATIRSFLNQSTFHLEKGDPCLPIPWDWLVCSIEVPPRVTQLNLAGKNIRGAVLSGLNLSRLTILNLSKNTLTGKLPISLDHSFSLREVNLSFNSLSGDIPEFKPKSLRHLQTLAISNNRLSGGLSSLIGALAEPLYKLNLGVNCFNGPIPEAIGNLVNLRFLDLSYNNLTGNLSIPFDKLTLLTQLVLEKNNLSGVVPSSIWRHPTPLSVNLNNNTFKEVDLSTWSYEDFITKPSFVKMSLLFNEIETVLLPLEDMEQYDTKTLRLPILLLGGNPWCWHHPNKDAFSHRYLCRFDKEETFLKKDKSKDKKSQIITVAVTSGSIVSLFACFCSISMWRMRKRMRDLHEIQEVLAKDHVKPPFFKYEDLKAATKDFHPDTKLGEGAFGAVYKDVLVDQVDENVIRDVLLKGLLENKAVFHDGTVLAVKRLFPTEQNVHEFLNEVVLITGIKHRHLIQLKGCCVREKQRILVYEYAENNNLAKALWGSYKPCILSWQQRMQICLGIARGLSYLHEELQPTIIHRDIKPHNILLDKDLNAKIADFGLARPSLEDKTMMASKLAGTLGYFSPEYATQGQFTEKLDVYSFGVLVLEIVAGRKCIDHSLPPQQVFLRDWAFDLLQTDTLMGLLQPELQGKCSEEDVTLVVKTALSCLQEYPSRRPAMSRVVSVLTGNTEPGTDVSSSCLMPPHEEPEPRAFCSEATLDRSAVVPR